MNGRTLTDAQISSALRAHLPDRAYPGLRERILDTAETTTQQRALPSFFGALTEADPSTRRRTLLVAAALLVALALASAAAVGALRLLERDPVRDLSLEPPADVQAFVLSSYDRMPELPPVAMTWLDNGAAKGRIYVDRSGAVRFERYASADATAPDTYRILSGNSIGSLETVGSDKVWVVEDEAIGEDPRVFILAEIGSGAISFGGPGCEMTRNPDEAGNGTAATGWRYVGVEYVAGRPAHHLTCGGGGLWLDIETRLILRARGPLLDDAGQPIAGELRTIEVTEIAFGEQPAALFDLAPPEGIASVPIEELQAYRCARDPICSALPPSSTPAPTPRASTTPAPSVAAPSAVASTTPSQTKAALTWTPASLNEDWPAPVRAEPEGATTLVPILLTPTGDHHVDPTGDTGSDRLPWADIKDVTLCFDACLSIKLVSYPPPAVDPTEQWIAYGVVGDTDRDGVPNWRYGFDNMPGDCEGCVEPWPHRLWRTDLRTGWTETAVGDLIYLPSGTMFYGGPERLVFGGGLTGGGTVGGLPERFYAWASVIQDGRVVATDYAPDVGWFLPSPDAKP